MRQGLFEVYGEGSIGLKAEDLNRYSELLASVGFMTPEGAVIATGAFDQLAADFGLSEGATPEEIASNVCPPYLRSVNEELLEKMEKGRPYAIRSSALSERGGTGIYASAFFWPTGQTGSDLENLWRAECKVYASEFSADARLWRARKNAPVGMAILIQPVVGSSLDGHFLPTLAGTAYTSYHGMPTVRAAIGLGTTAVAGGGQIFNRAPASVEECGLKLWKQKRADALDETGGIEPLVANTPEIFGRIAEGSLALRELFPKLAALREHGDLYIEWAIEGDRIYAVQAAPYEDRIAEDPAFDGNQHIVLIESNDVLHSGKATCRRVVYVSDWFDEVAKLIEMLNTEIRGHLLIVPQLASSLKIGLPDFNQDEDMSRTKRLSFRHFSNASVVVEKQRRYTDLQKENMRFARMKYADHTDGRGASHFAQLCSQSDILFLGAEFSVIPPLDINGMSRYRDNEYIGVWNIEATVIVDTQKKRGLVYLAKGQKSEWNRLLPRQIMDWCFELRRTANQLSEAGKEAQAAPFYDVHYALPDYKGSDPSTFDPFALDKDAVEMCGGMDKVKASLGIVLAQGRNYVENRIWDSGLKAYLKELSARLA